MPVLRKWKYGGAVCGIWKVTETAEELRSLLTDMSITPDFMRYKSSSRQLEYLAVRALLLELTGAECRVSHHESGKPYLEDSGIRISISHTKGYVAVAVHQEKEVGIDIEYHSDRVKRVVSRFVSDKEMSLMDEKLQLMHDLDDKEIMRLNMYLLFWSAKETMFKMLDSHDVDFVKHLSIVSFYVFSSKGATEFTPTCFHGYMETREFRTMHSMKIHVEFYCSPDFVCTYSCLD